MTPVASTTKTQKSFSLNGGRDRTRTCDLLRVKQNVTRADLPHAGGSRPSRESPHEARGLESVDEEYSLQRYPLCDPALPPDRPAVRRGTTAAYADRPRSANRRRYPRLRRPAQRNRTHAPAARRAWRRWTEWQLPY